MVRLLFIAINEFLVVYGYTTKRCFVTKKKYFKNILVIGDIHAPYMHPDTVAFLTAVKQKYGAFDKVIQIGDEIDGHALSYHEKDPDLDSAKTELGKARKALQPIFKLFPSVDVLESNHGSLVYRKGKTAGLPAEVFKGYREILQAPKDWNWHFDLTINTPYRSVYFHHGKTSSIEKLSKNMAMNAAQGHYHSKFYISYWSSPHGLYWDMNVGCLADAKSLALAYGKNLINRPILGVAVIKNGFPQLIPMLLNIKGRWTGEL